jgi:hypothetical protein
MEGRSDIIEVVAKSNSVRGFTMNSWQESIAGWQARQTRYGCEVCPPASEDLIEKIKQRIGPIPPELIYFYKQTNGMISGWFELLPIENPDDIKRTWDGILRTNDPLKTKFLDRDEEMLRRFLVFASIGGRECAVIDRADNTIWYEEQDKEGYTLNQLDLSLHDFIDTCLREVQDLGYLWRSP